MQLEKLLVEARDVWVDYPDSDTFRVKVGYLSRKEMNNLRKRCITTEFNRKTRQPEEKLNEDKFVDIFTNKVVKGWEGFTLADLQELVLVDIGDQDPTTEVEYSEENAKFLVVNSTEFDTWLNEVAFELDTFR